MLWGIKNIIQVWLYKQHTWVWGRSCSELTSWIFWLRSKMAWASLSRSVSSSYTAVAPMSSGPSGFCLTHKLSLRLYILCLLQQPTSNYRCSSWACHYHDLNTNPLERLSTETSKRQIKLLHVAAKQDVWNDFLVLFPPETGNDVISHRWASGFISHCDRLGFCAIVTFTGGNGFSFHLLGLEQSRIKLVWHLREGLKMTWERLTYYYYYYY